MFNKEELLRFLLKSRTKTYAGSAGEVKPLIKNSKQLEYSEDDWFYRDIYYVGNGIFIGNETVSFKNELIWAMSYYGNFKNMIEEEIDNILKEALIENWETTRIWEDVDWEKGEYRYICKPHLNGSIENLTGSERIMKNGEEIYYFFYAGGVIKEVVK